MSRAYQIDDQNSIYFLTLRVVDWVDIFSRKIYADIVLESLKYCRSKKGLKLWAYVIMTNHVHLIVSAENGNLSDIMRDFKNFTATQILKTIDNEFESRRKWMLKIFEIAGQKHKGRQKYQFWAHTNHAIELENYKFTLQKLAYIHLNPVRAGYVEEPDEWMYSSQRNYSGRNALIEVDMFDL